MTQIATLSRLAEGFAGQPGAVQRAVLAGVGNDFGANDLARTILGRVAAGK